MASSSASSSSSSSSFSHTPVTAPRRLSLGSSLASSASATACSSSSSGSSLGSDFEDACALADIPAGTSVNIRHLSFAPYSLRTKKKRGLALFHLPNGQLYAVDNKCAHGKGQLYLGEIEEVGECYHGENTDGTSVGGLCVQCPKHQRKFPGGLYFNLDNGRSFVKEEARKYKDKWEVTTFRVKVRGGRVWVAPPSASSSSAATTGATSAGVSRDKGAGDETVADLLATGRFAEWECVAVDPLTADNTHVWRFRADPSTVAPVMGKVGGCWHVAFAAPIDGETVERDYTPISTLAAYEEGVLDILIKVYPDGVMTQHLEQHVRPGAMLAISGPVSTLRLDLLFGIKDGAAAAANAPTRHRLAVIAGGTCVTPALQVAEEVVDTYLDHFEAVVVLTSDHRAEDVHLSDRFEAVVERSGGVVVVGRTVTQEGRVDTPKANAKHWKRHGLRGEVAGGGTAPDGAWDGMWGRLDRQVLPRLLKGPLGKKKAIGTKKAKAYLSKGLAVPRTRFILCGPEGFDTAIVQAIAPLGYATNDTLKLDW